MSIAVDVLLYERWVTFSSFVNRSGPDVGLVTDIHALETLERCDAAIAEVLALHRDVRALAEALSQSMQDTAVIGLFATGLDLDTAVKMVADGSP